MHIRDVVMLRLNEAYRENSTENSDNTNELVVQLKEELALTKINVRLIVKGKI